MFETRDTLAAPQTKPGSEILFGTVVRKVSSSFRHGVLQRRMGTLLADWAGNRGAVGSEIEFRIGPPNEPRRSLLPDVAYVPYDGVTEAELNAAQYPTIPPFLAVEVMSPDSRPTHVAHKIDVYLRSGVEIVMLVDPTDASFTIFDRAGSRRLLGDTTFTHVRLPGLVIELAGFFAIG